MDEAGDVTVLIRAVGELRAVDLTQPGVSMGGDTQTVAIHEV